MCGIAGYIGRRTIPHGRIKDCLTTLRHRGPDNQAFRHFIRDDGHVYLLHARLNIIDLDPRANQPLEYSGKWITYNGEVYNHPELRAELERAGRSFRTRSDTEVLLQAIDHYGWSGLDKCEGMWGFAVFDQDTGELSLVRDRFGEKPVYLFHDADGTYFASEINALTCLAARHFSINTDQMLRFLVNGHRLLYKGSETFFNEVTELRAGHRLITTDGVEVRSAPYWSFSVRADETMTYEDAVAGARERTIESVRIQLRSDVPLAFCLSGGVDSNAIVSVAKNVFGYDVHGFTIVHSDERYDESDEVSASVAHLGIRHTAIPVTSSDFLQRMRAMVRHRAGPICTPTFYVHFMLMEAMAEHGYRIAVAGTAADELFTGYYEDHLFYLCAVQNEPDLFREALRNWERYIKPKIRNPLLRDPELFLRNPGFHGHLFGDSEQRRTYLKKDWSEPYRPQIFIDEPLRNQMLNNLFHQVVPGILHEDDHNAMAVSIENRSPFLNRQLFDFTLKIPTRHLIRDGRAKAVLRDAMNGIVTDEVLDQRQKTGFNAPIETLLDLDDADTRALLLDDSPLYEIVRKDKVESLMEKRSFTNNESLFLFILIGCKMLLEEF